MDKESKWRPVTVLPNEQQLSCVSVAQQDNLMYTVGGVTSSDGEKKSKQGSCTFVI